MSVDAIWERNEVSIPALMKQPKFTLSQMSDRDVVKWPRCIYKFSCYPALIISHRPDVRTLDQNTRIEPSLLSVVEIFEKKWHHNDQNSQNSQNSYLM